MEFSSLNEIICPFNTEWKFHRADLMDLVDTENDFALKDFETERLNGKFYYSYNIPGLQCYLAIYPTGEDEEDRGETWALLFMNGSNERKFSAEFTLSVESANFSKNFNYVYDHDHGHGAVLCKTEEFFDSKSKYFVNGEITINVTGILKAKRPSTSIISAPISMEWKIKEYDLKVEMEESDNARIFSETVVVSTFPEVVLLITCKIVHLTCYQNDWLDYTTIMEPTCAFNRLTRRKSLLFIVKSAPHRLQNREEVRATWEKIKQFGNFRIRIIFVMEKMSTKESETYGNVLEAEHKQFNDLLIENFIDGPSVTVPFIGSLRYSSIRTHMEHEQGPEDDYISLIYVLAEMVNGKVKKNGILTKVSLHVESENEEKIETVYDFCIDSVNYRDGCREIFEPETVGCGFVVCSTADLFDPSKKFMVDGVLTINLNGILMVERDQLFTLKVFKTFALKSALKRYDKNFMIVVGNKNIQVHKQVLIDASHVWAEMLKFEMTEAIENKTVIQDFPFKIVDISIKLLYGRSILLKNSLEDMLLLYKFGHKFRIKIIMDLIEEHLIKEISSANVVNLLKFSSPDALNIIKLHQKCIDYFMKCLKETTPIYAAESLGEMFLASMVSKSLHSNFTNTSV